MIYSVDLCNIIRRNSVRWFIHFWFKKINSSIYKTKTISKKEWNYQILHDDNEIMVLIYKFRNFLITSGIELVSCLVPSDGGIQQNIVKKKGSNQYDPNWKWYKIWDAANVIKIVLSNRQEVLLSEQRH